MLVIFTLIGISSVRHVLRDVGVEVGLPSSTRASISSSRSNSRPPTVVSAPYARAVSVLRADILGGLLPCDRETNMRLCKPHASINRRQLLLGDMRCAKGLKPPFLKVFAPLVCVALATSVRPKRTCSIWELLWLSILFALWLGWTVSHWLLLVFLPMNGSTTPL